MQVLVRASFAGAVLLVAGAWRPAAATAPAYYTAAQAAAGAKLYGAHCSTCHGAKLEGITAPALRGDSPASSQSVAEVYEFMTEQMPMGKPGSLSPAQYAALMAYLLHQNGFRAGTARLTGAAAAKITARY